MDPQTCSHFELLKPPGRGAGTDQTANLRLWRMITDCAYCKATVNAEVVSHYDTWDDEMGLPNRYTFAKCPACAAPFLLVQEQYGDQWDTPHASSPHETIV